MSIIKKKNNVQSHEIKFQFLAINFNNSFILAFSKHQITPNQPSHFEIVLRCNKHG